MSTDLATAGNLADLLRASAADYGGRSAVIERDRETTYVELASKAAGVAEQLGSSGFSPGDRAAIFLERGVNAVAAYFGVLAAGGTVIIVNDRLRPRQLEHVLGHAGARALLTSADMLARQPRAVDFLGTVVNVEEHAAASIFSPVPRLGGDYAQIVYTSGSTGLPKGVTFTHANLHAGVRAVVQYLGLHGDDRVASLLPLSSVYGLNQLLCTIACGATLLVESSPVPNQIVAGLRDRGVTVLAAVPPLWVQLLSVPSFTQTQIPSLRVLQNAGGHLPTEAVRRLRASQPHARLFLQYGLTETFRSSYLPHDLVDRHPDSMGRAIPDAELYVLREDGSPCEPGEIGELVHRGPTVAAGYWGDPEATARVFRANPLSPAAAADNERVVFSGDMVKRDENGLLYYVARRDRLIKSLGYRIGPDEIVDVLFASGTIQEGLVTTEPDEQRGERIVAYVVLTDEGTRERLELYCRTELPRYMQPARIEVRSAIPRLVSGKYDLAAIKAERV